MSVAFVEQRDVAIWDEFSGRLEAIERVEVRSRVAGAVQSVHFREGALVKQDDLLITIDPAPYAAEVDRSRRRLAAAEARVLLTKSDVERGEQLSGTRIISQRELDQRVNAQSEAEANVRAAQAALQSAQLNLDYTQVRAPVAGRVGRLEITVGNLVAAGPGRAGADHTGVGQSDLCKLQRRRTGGHARAQDAGAIGHDRPRSSAFRCG